jgi:hypothetical protein
LIEALDSVPLALAILEKVSRLLTGKQTRCCGTVHVMAALTSTNHQSAYCGRRVMLRRASLVAPHSRCNLAALAFSHREIARIMQPLIDPLGIA